MDIQVHPEIGNQVVAEKSVSRMKYLFEKFGQFRPISVIQNGDCYFVVDGLIRLQAAKELGWEKISARKVDWQSEEIFKNRLISNVSSKRQHWQMAEDAMLFINNFIGKSRGKKRDVSEIALLVEEKNEKKLKELAGDVNKLTCEVLGLPFEKSTLHQLLRLYDYHQNCPKELGDFKLFEKLDAGEIKINRAFELANTYFKEKREQGNNAITGVMEYSRNPINNDPNHKVFTHTNADLSFLTEGSVSTVICSPPYYGKQADYKNGKKNSRGVFHGEESTPEEYIQREIETYRELRSKLAPDGSLFIVIGESFKGGCLGIPERLVTAMINDGWHYASNFYWLKDAQKPQPVKRRLQPAGEHILHFTPNENYKWRELKRWTDGNFTLKRTSGSGFKDGVKRPGFYVSSPVERFRTFIEEQNFVGVLKENGFNVEEVMEFGKPIHPCPFPVNLALFLMLLTTDVGDVTADVWSGIGQVAYAAKLLHRGSISIDVDKVANHYAVKRLQKCDHQVFNEIQMNELESYFTPSYVKQVSDAA